MRTGRNPYLFVVGCPRSGTTLLQRMLNAHPELAVTNDTHFITRAVKRMDVGPETPLNEEIVERVRTYRRFHRLGVPDKEVMEAADESTTYAEFVSRLYDRVAAGDGKPLAGEKTPDYCRSLPFLAELFPWARFVHIIRDGRDVALSAIDWARDGKGPSKWGTWEDSPVGTCALWWKWQAGTGIRDANLLGDRYQEILYADLVSDPEQTMRGILDGISLEYSPDVLEFARGRTRTDPSLSAKSAWLPPTPGLRDWRAQMDDDDVELFECIAGDLLSELGFERCFHSFRPEVKRRAESLHSRSEKWRSGNYQNRQTRRSPVIPASARLEPAALSFHDHEVIARDTAVPGLSEVLDGARLLERIGPMLSADVECLTPVYVRYKPGTNCLVSYEARSRSETFWLYAKAHGHCELEKLDKAESKSAEPTGIGPSTIVLKDSGIVVRQFPLDAKLPALWRFQNDPSGKIVDRLFDNSDQLRNVGFEAIRWKPERRLVTRMSVRGEDYAAVKFMTYGGFNRAWSFVRHRSLLSHIKSPQVVGHSKRLRAIAYEWLEGQVLADAIRLAELEPGQLDAVAAMLTEVHSRSPRNLPTILPRESVTQLQASAHAVQILAPSLSSKIDRIVANVSEWIATGPTELSFIHGDFYAKQVLVNGDDVALLDFDAAAIGNRNIDLGNFVAHLHRDRVHGRLTRSQATEAEVQFIGTYRSIYPSIDEQTLASYIAAGLLKLAPHPFRFREENWLGQIKEILDLAESYTRAGTFFESGEIPKAGSNGSDRHAIHHQDRRFISQALDHATMEARLNDLMHDGLDEPRPQLIGMKLLRQKPGRRSLIEYTLRDPADGSQTRSVLGKIRHKGLDRRTFELATTLFETSFGLDADDGIRVPEPLGCISELNMWLQERVAAPSVTAILSADPGAEFGERVARALHKLHSRGPRVGRMHGIREELATLEKGFYKVGRERPEWSSRLKHLLDRYRTLAESLDDFPQTPVHRDFYPSQVLIDDANTYLVDLDLYAMGDPALDVGNFIAHLWEMALRRTGDMRAFDRETKTFRETYLDLSGLPLDHNIHVYTWLAMARHIVISMRIPDRKIVTEQILNICESQPVDVPPNRVASV